MPIEPPTRCSTFSCGVAWESSSRSSAANAAVIAGMNAKPMPDRRARTSPPTGRRSTCARRSAPNGIVASVRQDHAEQRHRRRRRSGRSACRRTASRAPCRAPAGAVSRPVSTTLSWRTSCQYSGIRIIAAEQRRAEAEHRERSRGERRLAVQAQIEQRVVARAARGSTNAATSASADDARDDHLAASEACRSCRSRRARR